MEKYQLRKILLTLLLILSFGFAHSQGVLLDTVKSTKYDMGKMWTFDFPPVDYFSETYSFRPTQEWLDNVRMSALRFATYCSASFVSGDGLVMTNHHCGRESISQVEKENEDLHKDGFLAMKLEDERQVPGLFVDQLVRINDVTDEIRTAVESGKTDDEKVSNKSKKISELEKKLSEESGFRCQIVTLYNGGKYSAYFYKRYNDVRLVFAPEDNAGFFGGDPDNFTYPRYNLDCTFFRVYDENGKPLKTDHFFKWSKNGASEGEPIFVVGNPGRTERLNTVAQLEFRRDHQYPDVANMLTLMVDTYTDIIKKNPERAKDLNNELFSYANSQKVYKGMLKGLNDQVLMARKKHFEKTFREAVESNPSLKSKYGKAWDEIASINKQLGEMYPYLFSYSANPRFGSKYFQVADKLVNAALKNEKLEEQVISSLFTNYDPDVDKAMMYYMVNDIIAKLGNNDDAVNALVGNRKGNDAVEYLLSNSTLGTKEGAMNLLKQGNEAVLKSNDPFIKYFLKAAPKYAELKKKADELRNKESVNRELLGRAAFEVFGTSIPPDATFTLRISDGVIKPYEYNGTIAPPRTTFYGMYDRYYSFDKQYPWQLPDRWINPPKEFDLETPFNFISTNDIIGGNSGSPVINANAEIVGLAFDGNIESLTDNFIYLSDVPHTVSVDSQGLLETVKDLYKVKRLAMELETGYLYSGE